MPIRIVHTADNHIGIPFQRYPAATRSKLVAERFDARAVTARWEALYAGEVR